MSSQHGAYDQALLDEAPAATRAQRQEGYNVDLLDSRPTRPLSTQPLQSTSPPITPRDIESFSKENVVPPTYAQKSTRSFWRSRNGVITMFVIAVVVLGAVIGGAVGGTVGKNSNNNVSPTPGIQSNTSSASSTTSSSPSTSSTPTPTGGSLSYSSSQPTSAGVGSGGRPSELTTVSAVPTASPSSTDQVTQDISSENVVSGDLS